MTLARAPQQGTGTLTPECARHAARLFAKEFYRYARTIDRLYLFFQLVQFMAALLLARVVPEQAWGGATTSLEQRTDMAMWLGGILFATTALLVTVRPGAAITRYAHALVQPLWVGLLVQLCGGHTAAYFHIFGSLMVLAYYRDAGVLGFGAAAIFAEHLARTVFFPATAYGVPDPSPWLTFEYLAWVAGVFALLMFHCVVSRRELRVLCRRQAKFEESSAELRRAAETLEDRVRSRTAELLTAQDELRSEMAERDRVEEELRMSQKLESVGRLAAGVAHEINTPIQFVGDSVSFLSRAFTGMRGVLGVVAQAGPELERSSPQVALEIKAATRKAKLEFLEREVPSALASAKDGLERVAKIVRAMTEFAQPEKTTAVPTDVNELASATALLAANEYKYVAELELGLGALPLVPCHGGQIGQVLLHLIVNAAHAIEPKVHAGGARGHITLRSSVEDEDAVLTITDDGIGIPSSILGRVFDPFFTTKEVGKGSGQGLTIVRGIVQNHGGRVEVESQEGAGTTVRVRLPLLGRAHAEPTPASSIAAAGASSRRVASDRFPAHC